MRSPIRKTSSAPFVLAGARALGDALTTGASALYAESVAQALVVHLALSAPRSPRRPAAAVLPLGAAEVRRIDAYLRSRLGDDLTVDELAGVANVSKFHFIRAFAAATGLTPYRYLRRLRMHAAADCCAPPATASRGSR